MDLDKVHEKLQQLSPRFLMCKMTDKIVESKCNYALRLKTCMDAKNVVYLHNGVLFSH